MGFKELKDEQSLTIFASLTEKHISVRFPIEYLKKSKVVAFVNDAGEIMGGYVLVLRPPFRVIDSLPDEVRRSHPMLKKVNLRDAFELTGLWLSPEMNNKLASCTFWLRLYWDLLTLRKKYFVYAYGLHKTALERLYSIANPKILFRGLTKMQPGMKQPESESVEIVAVRNIVLVPLFKPHFFAKRLILRRTLADNLDYQQILDAYEIT